MNQKTHLIFRLLCFCLCFSATTSVFAQNSLTIVGKVVDVQKEPIIGAYVKVKDTDTGTITDIDGNFTLANVSPSAALIISYLGYETREVRVDGKKSHQITLMEDSKALEEVVVVGYGVQKKSDLTGAVSSVKANDLLKTTPTGNIVDALQGRMSGVSIVSGSGDPSVESTIRVRGITSINAEGGPLVVVDGFIGGSLQALIPSDIQSIEVLKDASATAVYGSRGANGVILVTTKNPKNEDFSVTVNSFVNFKTIAKKPDILSPYEYAKLSNDYGREYNESQSKPAVSYYNEEQLEAFKNGTAGFNYFNAMLKDPALSQNYEVSISGGGEKTSILASVRYNKDEGLVEKNYSEMYNYRLKADVKLKKWLDVGLNFSGFYGTNTGPRLSQYNGLLVNAMYFPNTVNPYNDEGEYNNKYPISGTGAYNPMGFINEVDKDFSRQRNNLQGFLNIKIIDGLMFRSQLGVDLGYNQNKEAHNSRSYSAFASGITSAYAYSKKDVNWLNTNTLNYINTFNTIHRVNLTAVYEQSYNSSYWHKSEASELDFPDQIGSDGLGWSEAKLARVSSDKVVSTMASWMFRGNYVLMDRYMLTASIRGDGSSRLAKKWDYFPSVALAWDIKQESFMDAVAFMDQLKLRVGYGSVGNQAIEPYRIYSAMKPGADAEGNTVYVTARPAARYLRWERNNQTNIGVDMSFLSGKITAHFDWYSKLSKDVLLELNQPSHMGNASLLQNSGEIKNTGFEITVGATPIVTKSFSWNTQLTMSHNKSIFQKIPTYNKMQIQAGNYENTIMRMIEGQKVGTFWGYTYEGVWQPDEVNAPFLDINGNPNGMTNGEFYSVKPGNPKYKDVNKDGKFNEDDAGIIGNGQPSFNWGFNNTFSYKNFDLSVFIIGMHGFDIYNATDQIGYNTVPGQNMEAITPKKAFLNRWTPDNMNTTIPGFVHESKPVKGFSSQFVEKGDFIKIKNITLGYTLPESISQRLKIRNLRVYGSIQNLFTITSYSGLDPEATLGSPLTQGVDWGSYPNSRNYLLGLGFTF